MMPGLLAAAITIGVFLAVQVAIFNLFHIVRRFQALAAMWFALLALYVAMFLFFQHRLPQVWLAETDFERWVSFVNGAVVYLLLFLIYLCLYFTDHSLTVAYAIEFEQRGQMTRDDIKRRFPHNAMLEQRLADLTANSYVVRSGDAYCLAPKGKFFVSTLGTLKRLLKLELGG
jgi:hypothetical protein